MEEETHDEEEGPVRNSSLLQERRMVALACAHRMWKMYLRHSSQAVTSAQSDGLVAPHPPGRLFGGAREGREGPCG